MLINNRHLILYILTNLAHSFVLIRLSICDISIDAGRGGD